MRAFAVWLATRASDGEWQLSIEDIVEVGRTALRSWESGLPASAPAANLTSRPSLAATRCHAGARAAVDAVAAPERTSYPTLVLVVGKAAYKLAVTVFSYQSTAASAPVGSMPQHSTKCLLPSTKHSFFAGYTPREIIAGWPAPTILAKPHFRTDAHRATFRISTSRLTGLVT